MQVRHSRNAIGPGQRSTAFFVKLGFGSNPSVTDDTAACMLVGEQGPEEFAASTRDAGA